RLDLAVGLRQLAKDGLEKDGPFEPPVAVKLRVVWRDDDRLRRHRPGQMLDLKRAVVDEVTRVLPRLLARDARLVRLLVDVFTGDPVVLQAGHETRPIARDLAHQLALGQIESDVPIEVAVKSVSRIPLLARPYLAARLRISSEKCDAARAHDRGVHSERG